MSPYRFPASGGPKSLEFRRSTQSELRSTVAGGRRWLQVASRAPISSSRRGERLSLLRLFHRRPGSAQNRRKPPRFSPIFAPSIRRAPATIGRRTGRKRTASERASKRLMDGGLWWPESPPVREEPPRASRRRTGRRRRRLAVFLVAMERGRGDDHFGGWFVAYGGRTVKITKEEEQQWRRRRWASRKR